MIGNARMYSVAPAAATAWQTLLTETARQADVALSVIVHDATQALDALWARDDMGAVFMCGLPFSRAKPQPRLLAAPVPTPDVFASRPEYWSEVVVLADSAHSSLEDTFGGRLALTVPGSQSGCVALLSHLMDVPSSLPLYDELIAPTITPLGALSAVIEGTADVAPIDAYAFALLRKYRPELTRRVRSVAQTRRTPIPPLVANAPGSDALGAAFLRAPGNAAATAAMADLLIKRFVAPDPASYAVLVERFEVTERYWASRPLAARIHPAFVL